MEEEEIFPFETSMDGFLRSNCISTEQEYILLRQSDIGVDDNDEATASKVQAGAREESAILPIDQQQGMIAWSTDRNRQFDRGRSRVNSFTFLLKRNVCHVHCIACCFSLVFCLLPIAYFPVLSTNCRSRYERRYELFGCTGCVNYCTRRRAFAISIFRR